MGADLLPIGMFTDVSANALGGGAGALPFAGEGEVAGAFQSFLQSTGESGKGEGGVPSAVEGLSDAELAQGLGKQRLASQVLPGNESAGLPADAAAINNEKAALNSDVALQGASGDVENTNLPGLAMLVSSSGVPSEVADDADIEVSDADASDGGVRDDDATELDALALDNPSPSNALYSFLNPAQFSTATAEGPVSEALSPLVSTSGDAVVPDGALNDAQLGAAVPGTPGSPVGGSATDGSGLAEKPSPPILPTVGVSGLAAGDGIVAKAPAFVGFSGYANADVSPAGGTVVSDSPIASADAVKAAAGAAASAGQTFVGADAQTSVVSSAPQAQVSNDPQATNTVAVNSQASAAAPSQSVDAPSRRWQTDLPEISRARGGVAQGWAAPVTSSAASSSMMSANGGSSEVGAQLGVLAGGAGALADQSMVSEDVDGLKKAANRDGESVRAVASQTTANQSPAAQSSNVQTSGAPGLAVKQTSAQTPADPLDSAPEFEVSSDDDSASRKPLPANSAGVSNGPEAAGKTASSGGAAAMQATAVDLVRIVPDKDLASDDAAVGGEDDMKMSSLDVRNFGKGDLGTATRVDPSQTAARLQTNAAAAQVAGAIARNAQNGQTRFQMRLDPAELGRIDVHMKMASDGSVQAHLIVERPETLDLFMRDQRGLEKALESAGLNTDSNSLQFSLQDQGGQQFASSQDDQGDAHGGRVFDRAEDGAENHEEQISQVYLSDTQPGLDIRI
ncbi:flagellar hook-length control protein FliK [Roseibium algae]|uniref:Flagellar hook-length control protein FliK n=1 Tax=Roseibium algae TaxID=3123038 RepID=A0ABU8TEZ7_9HYPH